MKIMCSPKIIQYIFIFIICLLNIFLLLNNLLNSESPSKSSPKYLSYATEKKEYRPPNEETKKWLLATGGIVTYYNKEPLDSLKSNLSSTQLTQVLYDFWGVTTRENAIQSIAWLKTEGHGRQFEKLRNYIMFTTQGNNDIYSQKKGEFIRKLSGTTNASFLVDFAWKNKDNLSGKNLMAWDNARLINVARWSYSLGLITEEEAWRIIELAGAELQKNYSSWKELGQNYMLGRAFWLNIYTQSDFQPAVNWLETNSESPWNKLPWDLKLDLL